jgi:hypothetical protein
MRAVARANLVMGLAAVCFALYAISLDPATFRELQLQVHYTIQPLHPLAQSLTPSFVLLQQRPLVEKRSLVPVGKGL